LAEGEVIIIGHCQRELDIPRIGRASVSPEIQHEFVGANMPLALINQTPCLKRQQIDKWGYFS
jgi:hypothetical protein